MTLAFREVDDPVLPPLGHPTILIIDDDTQSRDSLAATLSVEGFDVVTATNGDEGVALVASASPSLVLLDMQLADSQGLAVFRRIATMSPVPVIMVTSRDDELDAVLALEAGAADHITKPPRPRELTARIRAVLRRVGRQPLPGAAVPARRRLHARPGLHRHRPPGGGGQGQAGRPLPQGVRPPGPAGVRGRSRGHPPEVHGADLAGPQDG